MKSKTKEYKIYGCGVMTIVCGIGIIANLIEGNFPLFLLCMFGTISWFLVAKRIIDKNETGNKDI